MSEDRMYGTFFLGKPAFYWVEVAQTINRLGLEELLKENARLRQRAYIAEGRLADVQRIVKEG